jgi:ribosomal protein L37E
VAWGVQGAGWWIDELAADFSECEGMNLAQVDMMLHFEPWPGGITESVNAWGETEEQALATALELVHGGAFRVLRQGLLRDQPIQGIGVSRLEREGEAWWNYHGPPLIDGSELGKLRNRLEPTLNELVASALKRTELPVGRPHWAQICGFHEPDGRVVWDCFLDHQRWEEGQHALAAFPWPDLPVYQRVLNFLLVVPQCGRGHDEPLDWKDFSVQPDAGMTEGPDDAMREDLWRLVRFYREPSQAENDFDRLRTAGFEVSLCERDLRRAGPGNISTEWWINVPAPQHGRACLALMPEWAEEDVRLELRCPRCGSEEVKFDIVSHKRGPFWFLTWPWDKERFFCCDCRFVWDRGQDEAPQAGAEDQERPTTLTRRCSYCGHSFEQQTGTCPGCGLETE